MTERVLGNYEIITPKLTVVDRDDLRAPIDGEIILSHDVDLNTLLSGRIGTLTIFALSNIFGMQQTGAWHVDAYDFQAHLTTEGVCEGSFAAMVGGHPLIEKPSRAEFEAKQLVVDILKSNDLIVFGGSRRAVSMYHHFTNITEHRRSMLFPAL